MRITLEPGSISHGTLRPQDLLFAFANALEQTFAPNTNADVRRLVEDAYRWATQASEADPLRYDRAHELLVELEYALDAVAPDGYYFGSHEGDGSDFGLWPIEDDED